VSPREGPSSGSSCRVSSPRGVPRASRIVVGGRTVVCSPVATAPDERPGPVRTDHGAATGGSPWLTPRAPSPSARLSSPSLPPLAPHRTPAKSGRTLRSAAATGSPRTRRCCLTPRSSRRSTRLAARGLRQAHLPEHAVSLGPRRARIPRGSLPSATPSAPIGRPSRSPPPGPAAGCSCTSRASRAPSTSG
jgi:hypothetical protein